MIEKSFIILPKVGAKKEQELWKAHINTWQDFMRAQKIPLISSEKKQFFDRFLKQAINQLHEYNAEFFRPLLPTTETWRLYEHFKEDACFLDIETSGQNGYITVVGVYDGYETKTLIKGKSLYPELIKKVLQPYKLIITFNGSTFDLPMLEKFAPNMIPNIPHIDLRHCCAKLDLTGGLKHIEEKLNIHRPLHLKGYGGDHAIDLWRAYIASGREEYLNRLVEYNNEDTINLKPLAEYCYKELKKKILITCT
ncbi:ribonuclease H-like domain-containing protein [Candidatus Woesearchaeota archaeon]|nr:ribonuclease H-like domain-containing protein [Candidatus Woesearchaeota archaeon]